ncbi:MAG: M20/M25/M40 family metallo-hydrolase, partial [Anaerolineae bacterium]|nr:M20/M25/M40 family metallo-hydrolase [Anaerolineae bacterium]
SEVCITVEFRHPDEALLVDMEDALHELSEHCASAYHLDVKTSPATRLPAALLDLHVTQSIEKACDILNITHQRLASYASHNAQTMSSFVPSGLFFIPSINGISHHPSEYSKWEDVVSGTNVMLHTLLTMALLH